MKAVKISLLLTAVLSICGRAWCDEPNGPNEPNGVLVSHWMFEESSGNTAYDSVGGNHGFVSEPNWVMGKVGGALGFDGIGGYVDVGDKESLDFGWSSDFTVGLWFWTYMTKAGMFVNKRAAGRAPGYDLFINGGHITARISNSLQALAATTGGTYNDISWHHLAAVYDRDDIITIYVDGNEAAGSADIGTIGDIDNTQPFTIGDRNDVGDHAYFEGIIDELMVFNKALTVEEIQEIYESGMISDVNYLWIEGPNDVLENSTVEYRAMASYTDGRRADVTDSVIWSVEAGVDASIDENGVLTVGDLETPRYITIYAEYPAGGVTFDAQRSLEVYSLASVEITGPAEVLENSQAQYTARAHYDNGGTQIVTSLAVWSVEPDTYASISGGGLLTSGDIGTLENVAVRAEYSAGGATVQGELAVEIYSLAALEITGPGVVIEYTSAQYAATAHYSNGSTADVTGSAVWSAEPNAYASIDETGLLTAKNIEAAQEVTVYAEYAEGGVTVDAELVIQITVYVPQTLYVPADYNTIQAAIDAAVHEDIVIVADGTYTGEGNRDIDFRGKAITVKSANGPENCIIDCNSAGNGFRFGGAMEGPNLVIDGFTITNGYYEGRGGAIYCSKSSPTIKNCIITDCSAEEGGGIWCQASPQIINCTITNNRTDNMGAGIYCDGIGSPAIINCAITNNSGPGSRGTAIFLEGSSSPIVVNSTITQNTIGGIRGDYGDGSITIKNSILWGNGDREIRANEPLNVEVTYSDIAGGWEGIGNIDADPRLTPDGHLRAGSPCMDAGDPNGDYTSQLDVDGEARLMGSRVDMGADEFLDTDGDGLPDWWESKYFGSATAAGADGDPDGDSLTNLIEYEVYSSDPTVGSVSYYVDAENGDDNYDGRAPEWDGEHGPKRTIQAGIDTATSTDTVVVAPGRYVENIDYKSKAITVRSGEPSDWDVVENTIIDGSEGEPREDGSCVVFDKGEGRASVLEGLTLTRGTGGGAEYHYDRSLGKSPVWVGGGILCSGSSPTIRRCIIRDNGLEDRGPYGGGMALLGNCRAMISDCFIVHNTGGGRNSNVCGIVVRGVPEQARSTFRNCTIAYNTTYEWDDWAYQVDCGDTRPRICNTIIWNTACEGHPDCNDYYPHGVARGYTRSLLIKDASLVTYSCVKNAFTYADEPWAAEPCDLTLFGGNTSESPGFVGAYIEDYPNDADYHLMANSACVNAGDPNFVGEAGEVDIDGEARVMGGRIDIGADEVVPEIVVISPTTGDIWTAGSLHVVEWSSYGARSVDILLSVDGGGSWVMVGSGVADSRIYMWDVSASIDSDQCVISVVPNPADANVVTIGSGVFSVWPYHGPASLPRRRGWRPDAGERYGPEFGCVKWKFETEGPVTAAVALGHEIKKTTKAYIACEDGKLYALDADTGALVWSYDTNSPLFGSAAEGRDGTVYVGSEGGKLYAIDKNGQLLWTHTTGGPIYSTPAVTPTGRIYVCSVDGLVYALARDGSELWRFETNGSGIVEGSIFATPAVGSDGTVYIGGLYDPNLYALNRDDGSVKWVCNFKHTIQIIDDYGEVQDVNVVGWPFASPLVAPDGTVYQGLLFDTYLFAIEPIAGGINWSTNLAGLILRYGPRPEHFVMWYGAGEPPEYVEVDGELRLVRSVTPYRHAYCWSTPALGPDGTIYVSFNDPYLRAIDPNGTIKWMTKLGEMGGFTLSVGDDGLIYAASDDHYLYVVEPDGGEIARFEGDDWLSHPVIAEDHTIIVSDANNTVWAISEEVCDGEEPVLNGAGEQGPVVETKRPVKIKKQPKNTANMRVKRL